MRSSGQAAHRAPLPGLVACQAQQSAPGRGRDRPIPWLPKLSRVCDSRPSGSSRRVKSADRECRGSRRPDARRSSLAVADGRNLDLLRALWSGRVTRAMLVGLGYCGLSRRGLAFVDDASGVTALWPASGLAMAALRSAPAPRGPRSWWRRFSVIWSPSRRPAASNGMDVLLASANALEPVLAAGALRWASGRRGVSLRTVRDVWGLVVAVVGAMRCRRS